MCCMLKQHISDLWFSLVCVLLLYTLISLRRKTNLMRPMLLVFQLQKDEEYKMLLCMHTALKLIYICHSSLESKVHFHQFI